MDCISHMDVKSLWGNSNFDFVASDSLGNSGGILCIWEASIFKKDGATISDNFIAIYGTWLPRNVKILLVAVYAPQQPGSKRALWDFLSNLVRRWNGEAIIMGDFNDVRTMDERLGSSFNVSSARCFDRFIVSSGLVDVKLEGYSFTWSHPSASKMSKLDRFLVTEGIISLYPSISALCLDRHLSDHRPILLREVLSDFGPTPFRFYQSWLRMEGFDSMVEHAWLSFSHSDSNAMVRFKKKLQDLKSIIRLWVKDKKFHLHNAKNSLQNDLISIDKDLERGNVSDDILLNRMDLNRRLQDIKLLEVKDLVQKSKIKWAIEGDENSKFFHGIINKKRSQLSIRGVFVEGTWCTDPSIVKEAFKNHFEVRFQQPCHDRLKLNAPFHNRLSSDQVDELDRAVSRDEIRRAVWNCGENKSPGPDGYTFEFFRKYWSLVGADFCDAVDYFFKSGTFPRGCNSSFIALIPKVNDAKFVNDFRPISLIGCVYKVITKVLANRLATVISDLVSETQSAFVANRQILDGPFILNEMLNWCKRKKKQAMFFKVDFAKAYDSVRWDYLLDILHAFGFGPNWCRWIRGTFTSSMASILVNGSPTSEFPFCCGLKQGLLKVFTLHGSVNISHLFLCDDAMFIVFVLGSRLGGWLGESYNSKARLSKWKVKTLSIGGRLTLLKSVLGASPIYYMSIFKVPKGVLKTMESIRSKFFNGVDSSDRKISWVAWDNVLASKLNGGLGVSSFFALNRALLLKWVWRFISGDGSLWNGKKRIGGGGTGLVLVFGDCGGVRDGAERQQWDDLSSIMNSVVLSSSKDMVVLLICRGRWRVSRLLLESFLAVESVLFGFPSVVLLYEMLWRYVQQVFFRCDVARVVLRKFVVGGFGFGREICSLSDWDAWLILLRALSSRLKYIVRRVFVYVAWWRIWRLRNQLVFDASPPNRSTIFDDIVSWSFLWCSSRCNRVFS
ncbi:RNA-directed DNA polymerase, eukaryota [Tanacetum coccineum]